MQHSKVRKGICAINLNDAVLWKYNYSAAQKAFAQRPRLISALVGECIVGITSFIVTIGNNGGKGLKIKTYLL